MKRIFIGACLAALVLAGAVHAQSIYKCKGANGAVTYTDTPCKDQPTEVIHQASAREMSDAAMRQKVDSLDDMLINGRTTDAQLYAEKNGLESVLNQHAKILDEIRIQRAAAQAEQRQQALSQQNEQLRQQNAVLAAAAMEAQQQAAEANNEARAARAKAKSARQQADQIRNEAMTPKFNPETGQFCQTIGGTTSCH